MARRAEDLPDAPVPVVLDEDEPVGVLEGELFVNGCAIQAVQYQPVPTRVIHSRKPYPEGLSARRTGVQMADPTFHQTTQHPVEERFYPLGEQ